MQFADWAAINLTGAKMLQQVKVSLPMHRTPLLQAASRAYVPGPRLDDALAEARRLARWQIGSTIGYFSTGHETPREVADICLATIEQLARLEPGGTLALRAGALAYDRSLWREILVCAAAHGVPVQLDVQTPESVDSTLALVEAGLIFHRDIGITLPGRWLRSRADADRVADLGLRVRIVKGQSADPKQPQFDECVGFLSLISRIAGRVPFVSVATHDAALARTALTRLRAAGTPCELELMQGLPRQGALLVARDLGVRVRTYVPFGEAWTPYALGNAARNPRVVWWALRDSFSSLMPAN
jgi:proline dehydrogenase